MEKGLIVIIACFLFGCATASEKLARHGTLIPQDNGLYTASGSHRNGETAFKIALASAEQCCLKQNKRHIVLDTKTTAEEGLADEKTAKVVDIATNVAGAVGGFYSPIDGNNLRGKKYAQVEFKCE